MTQNLGKKKKNLVRMFFNTITMGISMHACIANSSIAPSSIPFIRGKPVLPRYTWGPGYLHAEWTDTYKCISRCCLLQQT
jgi:hypothetical protein